MTTFAETIKGWRERSRLVQKEAAEIIGVSVWTYRNWEIRKSEPGKFAKKVIEDLILTHEAERVGFNETVKRKIKA